MNLERIRERLANGFKPLALELSSRRRVRVLHPDFVVLGKRLVGVPGSDDPVTLDDALHIAASEELSASKWRK